MKNGIQKLLQSAGNSGCYALCLIDVAEEYFENKQIDRKIDVVRAFDEAIDRKYIYFNRKDPSDSDNFYVRQPGLFLEMLTGKKWLVTHDMADRQVKNENEYIIRRYERKMTGHTYGHFERDIFKPIVNSLTVTNGEEVSTRVCTVQ